MDYTFNAQEHKTNLIKWIADWFENNASPTSKAVIGISGGKDSTVVAKLCVEALGADRVFGVTLPMGDQANLEISNQIIGYLGVESISLDIEPAARQMLAGLEASGVKLSKQAETNLLPRIRMTQLYLVAQSIGGRVSNNCNLSETIMGYSTMWGDNVGSFSPLSGLTVHEVREIGHALGIPGEWVNRIPQDDLNVAMVDGVEKVLSDEDVLGVSYRAIDSLARMGRDVSFADDKLIVSAARRNMFKRRTVNIASYDPGLPLLPELDVNNY